LMFPGVDDVPAASPNKVPSQKDFNESPHFAWLPKNRPKIP